MNTLQMIDNFILVVEQGSITAAANHQCITSAAVSKRLKLLEQHLGTRLLTRNTRHISLTEAGEYYYHHNKNLLAEMQRVDKHVQDMQQVLKGPLKINTPMTYGKNRLTPMLVTFLELHPDIQLYSQLDDSFIDANNGEYDLIIRIGTLEDSELVARKLENISMRLVASPGYLQRHGTPTLPQHLQQHNCLHYTNMDQRSYWSFYDGTGKLERVKTQSSFSCNNGESLLIAAREGLGIALLPDFSFQSEIEDGLLIPLLPSCTFQDISAYAVYPSKRYLPEKTRTLINFLIEKLNRQ